jgi:diadenylate cyclase
MVVAILVLPFFYILVHSLDLSLSEWGFQNLWSVILIVQVVIFQQEIREVLGSIDLPVFFVRKTEAQPSKVVDEILNVAFQMANKRIGGLIVLQRADELDDFIRKKTILDAKVNEDLLVSIFSPQSPLHEGAVVIKGDQIHYAAALLPISQSPTLPQEWGTRHRAGVGIKEVSDSECIIISEEKGEVLLASQGEIQKKRGKEELKERLSAPGLIRPKRDNN